MRHATGGPLLQCIDCDQFLSRFTAIDTIVLGAGEKVFTEILETKLNGGTIPKKAAGNSGDRLRFPSVDIVTSRYPVKYLCSMNLDKCEWGRCKFCHHIKPDSIGLDSVQEFTETVIKIYKDKGVRAFYIFDNYVTPQNLSIFLQTIEKAGLNKKIVVSFFGARADRQFLDIIPLIKQTGIVSQIAWGLESFSQKLLSLYSKGIKTSNFEPILKAYSDIGVSNAIYMLFGLPSSSHSDIEATFDGLDKLSPYYKDLHYSWFLLSEPIDVFKNPNDYGIKIKDRYMVNDALGVDILGRYNIDTTFYDFDTEIDGQLLTRREDFRRYLPFLFEMEKKFKWPKANPSLLFLKSLEDMALYSASSHFYSS